jgi:nucleotide-binding universal stress UspA family protein
MNALDRNIEDFRKFAAPDKILVATDLNDAEYLIPHAVSQAQASGAKVILLHAILPTEILPVDAGTAFCIDPVRVEQEVEALLEEMARQVEFGGVPCEIAFKHGFAADVIREEIRSTGAKRLIMASHGRGKLGQFLLGSVAHQLIGTVRIPMFIAGLHPTGLSAGGSRRRPRHILYPVSLAPENVSCVELVIEMARSYGAELTLMHIVDRDLEKNLESGKTLAWVEGMFANVLPAGTSADPSIRMTVAFGNVIDEIRKAAIRMDVDWIVLGMDESHPFWPLAETTVYKVLTVADCPVMAIPRRSVATQKKNVPAQVMKQAIYVGT